MDQPSPEAWAETASYNVRDTTEPNWNDQQGSAAQSSGDPR
jgi:hypothetical protein